MMKASFGRGTLATCALFAAQTVFAVPVLAPQHAAQTSARHPLMAFGGRSAAQLHSPASAKLDATLADLVRHLGRVRPQHALEDLHALSPAARFIQHNGSEPLISVDAVTRGEVGALKTALVALGLQHPAVYSNDVGGWLPVSQIGAATERNEVTLIRAALLRAHGTPLATQGDFAQASYALRTSVPTLTGSGVTVGVLSDSFNCYGVYDQSGSGVPASGYQGYAYYGFADDDATFDETSGYLPASVTTLEEADCLQYGQPLTTPFTDEGRAILQIVHVVAPQASLSFYTASSSEADFATGIGKLAANGAKVIADDVGYFDEPFFQDGILAQAINAVAAQGVVYFSAAGNNSKESYENSNPQFGESSGTPGQSEQLLSFDSSGATNLTVQIPPLQPGEFIPIILQWDQPYVTGAAGSAGASSQLDLCVTGASPDGLLINEDGAQVDCTGPNTIGSDPLQVLILGDPANASGPTPPQQISITIGLANGTVAPGRIKLVISDDGAGSVIDPQLATNSPTVQGHPGAAGAAAVAAAFFAQTPLCGTSPAVLEAFSSSGGDPILFSDSGVRLAVPVVRQKPNITAPDGVNTSFFGFPLADAGIDDNSTVGDCANNATYLNFFGTSAATPHAAGLAALMLQSIPTLTPQQVIGALQASALPMTGATPNFTSGYGFIQATALESPVVWFPGSTVSVGNTATLNWVALESSGCSAFGAWSGPQQSSGTLSITPGATGSSTYTLSCTGPTGSATGSATLTAVSALAITTTALPGATAGSPYSATLTASGGVPPYTWTITGGTLPSGLVLNATTGAITGVALNSSAAISLSIEVTDAENPTFNKTTTLSLAVAAAPANKSASGGSGGGGALGALTLLLLAAVTLAKLAAPPRVRLSSSMRPAR
jgi:subtilisin family serine protease